MITIHGRLNGLNEYTKACRSNKYAGANMKKENQDVIYLEIRKQKMQPVPANKFPATLIVNWYEPNNKRDIDNITFAVKFIQDALVEAGIIPDDSQKYINRIMHQVGVDKENPRIEIEVI